MCLVSVDNVNVNLFGLLLAMGVDLLGIPVVAVACNSLYSKLTHKETQGTCTSFAVGRISLCTSTSY